MLYINNLKLDVFFLRYKNIISFFLVALPISVMVRLLQVVYTIDSKTGFFVPAYKVISFYMILVLLAANAAIAVLSLTSHRSPEKPPKVNPFLAISSVLLGISILVEVTTENFVSTIPFWQIIMLNLSAVLTAVFFFAYAATAIIKNKLPAFLSIFPAIYWIFRLICLFMSISSLSLISDNVLLMACYCVSLIFMVNFAKLFNGIKDDFNSRKLMASGLTSVTVCATDAIPRIILLATGRAEYLHSSASSTYTVLATGIFILAFVLSHFSYNNLKAKRHHHSSITFMPDDNSNSSFYV